MHIFYDNINARLIRRLSFIHHQILTNVLSGMVTVLIHVSILMAVSTAYVLPDWNSWMIS